MVAEEPEVVLGVEGRVRIMTRNSSVSYTTLSKYGRLNSSAVSDVS